MPTFAFQEILELGDHHDTPYRKLTGDHVSTFTARGQTFLEVAPEALTLLTKTAMRDIAHLLRPGHLAQLRAILDDPEAPPTIGSSRSSCSRTRASPRAASCPGARTPARRS